MNFEDLVKHLKTKGHSEEVRVDGDHSVRVFNPAVIPLLKKSYGPTDLDAVATAFAPSVAIRLTPAGLVQAADRIEGGAADPTNYDAVWLRDSLWVYLGLQARVETQGDAKTLLLKLADYLAAPAQRLRQSRLIHNPSLRDGPDGPMNVIHIRFNGRSPDFEDVFVNGQPQKWNHKQNDALGLWLDLTLRALQNGEIAPEELRHEHYAAIAAFPAYFAAIRYWEMEDAGSWEEIERTNSSSIGLVVSGLERLAEILGSKDPRMQPVRLRIEAQAREQAESPRVIRALEKRALKALIDRGYERVLKQIAAGGESPLYPESDPRHRKADAALLNLIYPARLSRLDRARADAILAAVQPLVGEVGIKRYLGDSYQSGNFWLSPNEAPADAATKTDDTSSAEAFAERGSKFIPDSEAQWFFDSWYSKAAGLLYERYGDSKYREAQTRYFTRALAQLTGGEPGRPQLGADGRPVPARALPESYNSIVSDGQRYFAASPITPLNWAKASLVLATEQMRRQ